MQIVVIFCSVLVVFMMIRVLVTMVLWPNQIVSNAA